MLTRHSRWPTANDLCLSWISLSSVPSIFMSLQSPWVKFICLRVLVWFIRHMYSQGFIESTDNPGEQRDPHCSLFLSAHQWLTIPPRVKAQTLVTSNPKDPTPSSVLPAIFYSLTFNTNWSDVTCMSISSNHSVKHIYWDRASLYSPGTWYTDQADLKLIEIPLPEPSECWN